MRIETQRGYPSKELFLKSDKLIPSDMPGGRQDIFCFVLQNSAIRCAKVPFLGKDFVDKFHSLQKARAHAHTHTHTLHFWEIILRRIYFWTAEKFLVCPASFPTISLTDWEIHSLMQNVPIRSGCLSWKMGTVYSHKSLPHTHFDGGTSARR